MIWPLIQDLPAQKAPPVQLVAFMYGQDNGAITIDADSEQSSAKVLVSKEDVPALLQIVMTALRVGGYNVDQLDACAKVCRANLMGYFR